jgi:hypothetical protein
VTFEQALDIGGEVVEEFGGCEHARRLLPTDQ